MFPPDNSVIPVDCAVCSKDGTCFFLNSSIVLSQSNNSLNGYLSWYSMGSLAKDRAPHTATILNIVFLSLYGLACAQFNPTFDQIEAAVNALPTYGVSPHRLLTNTHPLFSCLLSQASFRPLDVYMLATSYSIEDLAVATSSHLLSLKLFELSDEKCVRIGALYLKRLFDLHIDRDKALMVALGPLPKRHAPTKFCHCDAGSPGSIGGGLAGNLHKAWAQGLADLTWDLRPDISVHMLNLRLSPIVKEVGCHLCQESVRNRIKDVCSQWSLVRVCLT
jgi:hypothetical protein